MPDNYQIESRSVHIEETSVSAEHSTDKAELVIITHSEGQITLSFAFGKLISGEAIQNENKIKIK